MITIQRPNYTLLLSYNPCEIFQYYKIHEMHGLNLSDCQNHNNTCESAYIAGWSNFVPKESGKYEYGDKRFVFINLSRCKDIVVATLTAMHELMHLSMYMFDYNPEKEEEMITWADNESLIVVDYINKCMEPNYLRVWKRNKPQLNG